MQTNTRIQYRPRNPSIMNNTENTTASAHQLHHFDSQTMTKGKLMGPETLTMEYKNYRYPWDEDRKIIISKCICAFLNTQGGTLLIGIKQSQQVQQPKVQGFRCNPIQIEQLKKDVTSIVQKISIAAVANSLVKTEFVRVINPNSNQQNSLHVVRITVQKGWLENYQQLFNFQGDYYFRTTNEIKCYNRPSDLNQILIWRREKMMEEKRKEIRRREEQERLILLMRINSIQKPETRENSTQTDRIEFRQSNQGLSNQGMNILRVKTYENLVSRRQNRNERGLLDGLKRLWKKFTSICE